jgi:competence protein ComEA
MPVTAVAININTATADEFEKLPHIGRKTAETIVEFREQNGPFRRPESLMQIRGISEKRFLELREFLKTE